MKPREVGAGSLEHLKIARERVGPSWVGPAVLLRDGGGRCAWLGTRSARREENEHRMAAAAAAL